MPTKAQIDFSHKWRYPHFSANDLCDVSGIGRQVLRKYIRAGVLFTESQHKTTAGKARYFSLGDLCQARFMWKLMEVFEMSADRARHMAWGFTGAMHSLALSYYQTEDFDKTLLAVCWPSQFNDAYGEQAREGKHIQSDMDSSIYPPEFCGLVITRQKLWDTVVSPCLEFAEEYMEARRDDAQTNPRT